MPKRPIFVGIDPGTTTGYAILDEDKNLISLESGKNMGLNEILNQIIARGIPLVAGTDKAKLPDFVERFSTRTGCKTFIPDSDLKVEEKRNLAGDYKFKDSHQMDALASAVYAYNAYSNIIKRIKKVVPKKYVHQALIYVIRESIPVKEALDLLEGRDEEAKIVKKAVDEERYDKEDFVKVFHKLRRLKKENSLLQKYNHEIRERLRQRSSRLDALVKQKDKNRSLDEKKIGSLFAVKEKRLADLKKEIKEKNKKIDSLTKDIMNVTDFIIRLEDNYLIKRLRNLGLREYREKKSKLGIKRSDILLVEDINIYNKDVLDDLKEKVIGIIYEARPNKITKKEIPFELISSEDIDLINWKDFAVAQKEKIENKLQKKNILNRMIEEYKRRNER